MKLVLASNNQGKLAELQAMFAPLGVELVRQGDLGVGEAEEPFRTFVENALTKARFASQHTGLPALADSAPADDGHSEHSGPDGDIVVQIKELLDTRVRPAVAQDGGDITFHGFDRGVVYLHMQGACAGCPSSTLTLKMGIENLLRHYIPEVTEVRPVA